MVLHGDHLRGVDDAHLRVAGGLAQLGANGVGVSDERQLDAEFVGSHNRPGHDLVRGIISTHGVHDDSWVHPPLLRAITIIRSLSLVSGPSS